MRQEIKRKKQKTKKEKKKDRERDNDKRYDFFSKGFTVVFSSQNWHYLSKVKKKKMKKRKRQWKKWKEIDRLMPTLIAANITPSLNIVLLPTQVVTFPMLCWTFFFFSFSLFFFCGPTCGFRCFFVFFSCLALFLSLTFLPLPS